MALACGVIKRGSGAARGRNTRRRQGPGADPKDLAMQPLLRVAKGNQVPDVLALALGWGGPERRGHLGFTNPVHEKRPKNRIENARRAILHAMGHIPRVDVEGARARTTLNGDPWRC